MGSAKHRDHPPSVLCDNKRGMSSTPTRLVAREIDQEDEDANGGYDDEDDELDDEEALFLPEANVGRRTANGGGGGGTAYFDEQLDQLEVRFFLSPRSDEFVQKLQTLRLIRNHVVEQPSCVWSLCIK